jgi:sugar-specific transcriptional regulator TrmB
MEKRKKIMELKKFGLDQYESDVYLTLVREGICTAQITSKKSKVPHGKIYTILTSLEQKGFVKKFEGIPKRYVAVEPNIIAAESIRKKQEQLLKLQQKSNSMIKQLTNIKPFEEKEDEIQIIEGYKNYLNFSVKLHQQAEKEWCTISELSTYKPHIDAYRDMVKRGLKIKMLTSKEEATPEKLALWKEIGIQIRMGEFTPTKFSIIDNNQITLRFSGENRYLSLWIKNKSLAESMKGMFEIQWKASVLPK